MRPVESRDISTGTYPITFSTSVLFVLIKGNFESTQAAASTYNDLSMYSGFIPGGDLSLSTFKYRCAASNPYCLFIGC